MAAVAGAISGNLTRSGLCRRGPGRSRPWGRYWRGGIIQLGLGCSPRIRKPMAGRSARWARVHNPLIRVAGFFKRQRDRTVDSSGTAQASQRVKS